MQLEENFIVYLISNKLDSFVEYFISNYIVRMKMESCINCDQHLFRSGIQIIYFRPYN